MKDTNHQPEEANQEETVSDKPVPPRVSSPVLGDASAFKQSVDLLTMLAWCGFNDQDNSKCVGLKTLIDQKRVPLKAA